MPVRNAGPEPLAFASPSAQPGHVGRRPGLVDEDELLGVEIELSLEPRFPLPQNIRALLLGRMGGLFLNLGRLAAFTSAECANYLRAAGYESDQAEPAVSPTEPSPSCCFHRSAPS